MEKAIIKTSVDVLNNLLADCHVTYQNTRFCHWNVVGPQFVENHEVFEEIYNELAEFIDMFAEQVRQLEDFPVSKFSEYLKMSKFKEYELPMDATAMHAAILADLTSISENMEKYISDTEDDAATQDLIVEAKRTLDKRRWFLRAMNGKK